MTSGSSSHHSSGGRGRHGEGSSHDVHMESSSRAQDEEDEGHQQEPQVEMNTSQMSGPTMQTQFARSPFDLRERGRPRREKKYTPDPLHKGKNPATSTQNVEQGEEQDEPITYKRKKLKRKLPARRGPKPVEEEEEASGDDA